MNMYRIVKYNPIYRENGIYQKDEWTEYSDIGQTFDGELFTEQEYLKVEQNYIDCLIDLLNLNKTQILYVRDLEFFEPIRWSNNQTVLLGDLPNLISDCLRDNCWCRLENGDTFLHFGRDYYVYIGVSIPYDDVNSICEKYNLFCNMQPSPYKKQRTVRNN